MKTAKTRLTLMNDSITRDLTIAQLIEVLNDRILRTSGIEAVTKSTLYDLQVLLVHELMGRVQ